MGGGDSHGADDVVNVGAETLDDNLVAMYLGYYSIWDIDASDVHCLGIVTMYMARVEWDTFVCKL